MPSPTRDLTAEHLAANTRRLRDPLLTPTDRAALEEQRAALLAREPVVSAIAGEARS
jgi:hypothetical protein